MPDAIEMRVNLAADTAELDRLLGGWFGRTGSASADWVDAALVLSTWSSWRFSLVWYDAILDPSCHDAIEEAFAAAQTLESSLQSLHGHLRGWSGWLDDSQRDGHVSDALDRGIPLAVARLEACSG